MSQAYRTRLQLVGDRSGDHPTPQSTGATSTSGGVDGHAVDLTSRGAAAADGLDRSSLKPAAGVEPGPLTYYDDEQDNLRAFRGLMAGIALSIPLWWLILWALWPA